MYEFIAGYGERRNDLRWRRSSVLFVVRASCAGGRRRAVQEYGELRHCDAVYIAYRERGTFKYSFADGIGRERCQIF